MKLTRLYISVAISLTIFNTTIALFEFVCTEKGLFTPYLTVLKGRNGTKVFAAGPGFYDMREHADIYACVNGPAYLYFSHNTTLGEVFETPIFDIYTHKCGVYNKSPKRGHTHLPTENVKKLHGILVMGDPVDYRNPSVQLFTAPTYNYKDDKYENATSIITFGKEECTLEKDGIIITLKPGPPKDPAIPEYCFRAFGDDTAKLEEEDLLRATAPISVKGCNAKATPNNTNPVTGKKKRSIRFPMDDEVIRFKRHRSRRAASTPITSTGPQSIELKECKPLPTLEEECKKGKPDPAYACSMFDTMTGVKDPGWDAGSQWRKDVIELIGEIYVQTSPWVEKKFVKLVNRLVGFYLIQGLKDGSGTAKNTSSSGKRRKREVANATSTNNGANQTAQSTVDAAVGRREVWKFITEELQVCLKRGTRLQFTEEKQRDIKVHLYKKQGQTRTIIHMIEEADNDFAFNWVLDTHWKMFATVLGICTPTSRVKQNVISTRFYATYSEDFLTPLSSAWVEFKDNLIFQFILGEYYSKQTDIWLNDCLEASFIESNSESYRPLRPILVSDSQEDNYFVNDDVVPEALNATTTTTPLDDTSNV